jgi:hypothetical protein
MKKIEENEVRREEERLQELKLQISAEADRLAREKADRLAKLKREIEEATRLALATVK